MDRNWTLGALAEMAQQIDSGLGLRVVASDYVDADAQPGNSLPVSHVWDDGAYTDAELSGTSCLSLDWLRHQDTHIKTVGYWGCKVLVVGGSEHRAGDDDGEIIVTDAYVVAIAAEAK